MASAQKQCSGCGKAYWPAQAWIHESCVTVANPIVANDEPQRVANNPESFRVQVWRESNRERYNSRQRELMRVRRSRTVN